MPQSKKQNQKKTIQRWKVKQTNGQQTDSNLQSTTLNDIDPAGMIEKPLYYAPEEIRQANQVFYQSLKQSLFQRLTSDISHAILRYLPFEDRVRFSQVNKALYGIRNIITFPYLEECEAWQQSQLWRCIIECSSQTQFKSNRFQKYFGIDSSIHSLDEFIQLIHIMVKNMPLVKQTDDNEKGVTYRINYFSPILRNDFGTYLQNLSNKIIPNYKSDSLISSLILINNFDISYFLFLCSELEKFIVLLICFNYCTNIEYYYFDRKFLEISEVSFKSERFHRPNVKKKIAVISVEDIIDFLIDFKYINLLTGKALLVLSSYGGYLFDKLCHEWNNLNQETNNHQPNDSLKKKRIEVIESLLKKPSDKELIEYLKTKDVFQISRTAQALLSNPVIKTRKTETLLEIMRQSNTYTDDFFQIYNDLLNRLSSDQMIKLVRTASAKKELCIAILKNQVITECKLENKGLSDEDIIYLVKQVDKSEKVMTYPSLLTRLEKSSPLLGKLVDGKILSPEEIANNLELLKLLSEEQIVKVMLNQDDSYSLRDLSQSLKLLKDSEQKRFLPSQMNQLRVKYSKIDNIEMILQGLPQQEKTCPASQISSQSNTYISTESSVSIPQNQKESYTVAQNRYNQDNIPQNQAVSGIHNFSDKEDTEIYVAVNKSATMVPKRNNEAQNNFSPYIPTYPTDRLSHSYCKVLETTKSTATLLNKNSSKPEISPNSQSRQSNESNTALSLFLLLFLIAIVLCFSACGILFGVALIMKSSSLIIASIITGCSGLLFSAIVVLIPRKYFCYSVNNNLKFQSSDYKHSDFQNISNLYPQINNYQLETTETNCATMPEQQSLVTYL